MNFRSTRLVTIKEYFPADFAARKNDADAAPRSKDCAADYKWGLDRFIEEAQTLARFEHPNIVRVFRYFRANNTGYMVLQFEEGKSFKTWLKELGRAPRQAELDQIVEPLLEALDMIHRSDYLHRDIAPDNIIIRKDKSPVLIDFGSARGEIASQSRTVSALVKPGYSPYEQYATTTSQQGAWTDIYALGATLYQAVTGKRPPDAPSRVVQDELHPGARGGSRLVPPGLPGRDRQGAADRSEGPAAIDPGMAWAAVGAAREGAVEGQARHEPRLEEGDTQSRTRRDQAGAARGRRRDAGATGRAASQGPVARFHRWAEEACGARECEGSADAT